MSTYTTLLCSYIWNWVNILLCRPCTHQYLFFVQMRTQNTTIRKKEVPLQVKPSPVNPIPQVQLKLPSVFVQVAFALQLADSFVHSSISYQVQKKKKLIIVKKILLIESSTYTSRTIGCISRQAWTNVRTHSVDTG
jgi:hypothetical protein